MRPGDRASWDGETGAVTCLACLAEASQPADERPSAVRLDEEAEELDRGSAGGSAAREWRQRHDRRQQRIRDRHRHLGGVILALSDDPQSTKAWSVGARGEQIIGERLNRLREVGIAVLHDRRIPGSRANIDHLVISRAGVFVVDTKNYSGRVERRDIGGLFKKDVRLFVGGRDRTKLVTGMEKQVLAVRDALAREEGEFDLVPVTPVILFMADDNWPLLSVRPLRFGNVYVLWGRALRKLIRAEGPVEALRISELERRLAAALPPA